MTLSLNGVCLDADPAWMTRHTEDLDDGEPSPGGEDPIQLGLYDYDYYDQDDLDDDLAFDDDLADDCAFDDA